MEDTHLSPKLNDWKAKSDGDDCVHIQISETLDIDGGRIKFLGKDREPLIEMKISSRDIHLCLKIGNPTFVEMHTNAGVSVRYIEGSGKEYYKKK
jgi:hypothetical protein